MDLVTCNACPKHIQFIDENHNKLSTVNRLPKLHKRPYTSLLLANSNSCTTIELSKRLTFCLTRIKNYENVYERDGKIYFCLL